MLYSKTAQYSIQSMLFIAANYSANNILVRDIAKELDLPPSFLSKILQTLSRYGFLSSVKGPRGGFSLSEKGANSTIAQLVEVIDGPMDFDMCLAGFKPCDDKNPCPLHDDWKRIREDIQILVTKKTIFELAENMPEKYKITILEEADTEGEEEKPRAPKSKKTPAPQVKPPAKVKPVARKKKN